MLSIEGFLLILLLQCNLFVLGNWLISKQMGDTRLEKAKRIGRIGCIKDSYIQMLIHLLSLQKSDST